MENIFKKISWLFILFFGFLVISLPLIQVQGNGVEESGGISNPLDSDSFSDLISNIIDWLIIIGQSIAVIMIIWSGFLFMTSEGNEEKITKAKKSLTWALVGLLVLLIGDGFIGIVKDLLGN